VHLSLKATVIYSLAHELHTLAKVQDLWDNPAAVADFLNLDN